MWASLWGSAEPAPAPAAAPTAEEEATWYLRPSADQVAALKAFRERLAAEDLLVPNHDDDCTLLRFLMARDFNLDKATAMYRDMRAWRLEQQVEGLWEADPTGSAFPEMDRLLQVYPHFTFNTDRFGRPVYIELLGRTDAGALFDTISMERLVRYHIWTWERYLRLYLPACSEAAGHQVCTTTVVIDLAGLSMKNFNSATQKLLHTFSKIDQDYYPEHLGCMFVINTPLVFRAVWAMVQPLLQERTKRKIRILGQDYLDELTQVVPLERLPDILGGGAKLDTSTYRSVGPWTERAEALAAEARAQQGQGLAQASAEASASDAGSGSRGGAADSSEPQSPSALERQGSAPADACAAVQAGGEEACEQGSGREGLEGAGAAAQALAALKVAQA
ncbi:hypothetical protein HYH03_018079 [Edaphochlamys debaryana]|uniref:CRAL-TRIO domain-containing protein n=1 Tax=Edaphochlamys debaryana TaxID=47281 RepID=A0A835XL54_9CHLO|nr:hypothetical protein HYH03_018079 [Edaphochlamys debaryana]|eukprot:KAG2483050.1 hypothetical protein HYH03_018079 [Edaphochlamys debaryana]